MGKLSEQLNVAVDMTEQSGVTREIKERRIRGAYGVDNRAGGQFKVFVLLSLILILLLPS